MPQDSTSATLLGCSYDFEPGRRVSAKCASCSWRASYIRASALLQPVRELQFIPTAAVHGGSAIAKSPRIRRNELPCVLINKLFAVAFKPVMFAWWNRKFCAGRSALLWISLSVWSLGQSLVRQALQLRSENGNIPPNDVCAAASSPTSFL